MIQSAAIMADLLEVYKTFTPREQISFALDFEVLGNIDHQKLPKGVDEGIVHLYCPDSEQAPEYLEHKRRLLLKRTTKIGPIGWYGGALAIPRRSPIVISPQTRSELLWQLRVGHLLGKGDALALSSHCTCGMASAFGLCPFRSFDLLDESKVETEEDFDRRAGVNHRYYEIRQKYGRPLTHTECTSEALLNAGQVWRMQFMERLQEMKGNSVNIFERSFAKPEIVVDYHVDYGNLGTPEELRRVGINLKPDKTKLTHNFNRHNWHNAQQVLLNPVSLEDWRRNRQQAAA